MAQVPLVNIQALPVADAAALAGEVCAAGPQNHENEMRVQSDTGQLFHCHDPGGGHQWVEVAASVSPPEEGVTLAFPPVYDPESPGPVTITGQVTADGSPASGARRLFAWGLVDRINSYLENPQCQIEAIAPSVTDVTAQVAVNRFGGPGFGGAVGVVGFSSDASGAFALRISGLADSLPVRMAVRCELHPDEGVSGPVVSYFKSIDVFVDV